MIAAGRDKAFEKSPRGQSITDSMFFRQRVKDDAAGDGCLRRVASNDECLAHHGGDGSLKPKLHKICRSGHDLAGLVYNVNASKRLGCPDMNAYTLPRPERLGGRGEHFDPRIEQAFLIAGYQRSLRNTSDHLPPGNEDQPKMWVKWFFKPPEAQRPTNVHVRINGLPNQRYPLLFRDFLRAMPAAAFAYAQAKQALASYHADDADAYYAIKDPVCDIIIAGAEIWAAQTGWRPGSSDA